MPDSPRLAITLRRSPTGYGAGHQVQVTDRARRADHEQSVGRQRPADRPDHRVRRQVGLLGQQRVETLGDVAVGLLPARQPRRVVRFRGRRLDRRRTRYGRSAQTPRVGVASTSTSARPSSWGPGARAWDARRRRRARCCAQVGVEQQPVAAQGVARRCGPRWWVRRTTASRPPRPAAGPGAGIVTGDHHRARAERQRRRGAGSRAPSSTWSTRPGVPAAIPPLGDAGGRPAGR